MKFLLFSDSHNATNGMDLAIEKHKEICHIIHCGDMADDIEYLRCVYGNTHSICGVCGNNDFHAYDPYFRVFSCNGYKLFITHGHKEHVKESLHFLEQTVKNNGCTIGVFGHTHKQLLSKEDGLIMINPGSIGHMRQEYAILDIKEKAVDVKLLKL